MNQLGAETSPYLLQHKDNPVHWQPWGDEAFAAARERDVPVLVSIGYAACHWCHVMEHESFEDADTAALMNELFVCIKVDREERPDVDALYMDAVVSLTGQGGWPMTVFATPDGRPFYGGTYYPPIARPGLPAFRDVLRAVAEAWRDRRPEVDDTAGRLTEAISSSAHRTPATGGFTDSMLAVAVDHLAQIHDPQLGGFGAAPKFPQGPLLQFLLATYARTGSPEALQMVTTTLDGMALGGMYDVIGGGFHRYSVDGRWLVPHFEKMLYDNALLACAYLDGWVVTGNESYRDVAESTLDYMVRELRQTEGGFSSSQDADTDGVEGSTYVWTAEQLRAVLNPADAEAAVAFYAVTPQGNFEHGTTILRPAGEPPANRAEIDRALLIARRERPQPALDDKVIASWNGLALAALARGGYRLQRPDLIERACELADFLTGRMVDTDGQPVRAYRGGVAKIAAQLEDYAAIAFGLTELAVATADQGYTDQARGWANRAVELFADPVNGGFYSTAAEGDLVTRRKELDDNPIPSGNSLLAHTLLRLARIDGDAQAEQQAAGVVALAQEYVGRAPHAFGQILQVADMLLADPREVAMIGDPADPATAALLDAARAGFHPTTVYAFGSGEPTDQPLLTGKTLVDGAAAVYVCERFSCRAPVTDPAALA